MRGHLFRFICLMGGLMLLAGSASGAITLDARPGTTHIGDRVHLSGHSGIPNTIAVYLFVTGPGLNRAGVTLENLHLQAGSGYFTTAFVHPDGTFEYEWNTGFIVGHLIPGTYRIYVVNVPLNLERLTDMEEINMSYTDVTFHKPPSPGLAMEWGLPGVALVLSIALLVARKRKNT